MVNVGGRSRGCSTCRRRRVKCDETRPVCNRCARCGFECSGVKGTAFVEATIVKSRRTVKHATVSPKPHNVITTTAVSAIPSSPSLKAFELEVYICYSRKHLRRGSAIDATMQKTSLSEIIRAGTTATASPAQTFPSAIISFAMITFGTQHAQPPITSRGYANLSTTLQQLNHALSSPHCHTSNTILLSVAVLAILESVVPTGPNNFLTHMHGLERLLELRDPTMDCSQESCVLYKSVRHMMIFASLRAGKASFLARGDWKAVLRESCDEEEMAEQDLFDVLADCTVLIAKRDAMMANWNLHGKKAMQQRDKIQHAALTLLRQLRDWKKRWDNDERNAHVETDAAFAKRKRMHESREAYAPAHPLTIFEFKNEAAAVMFMFYNTTLIYVLWILSSLPAAIARTECSPSPSRSPSPAAENSDTFQKSTQDDHLAGERSAALDICRCIPYYSRQKARSATDTSPLIHWAVTTAWTTLSRSGSSEEKHVMDLLGAESREVTVKGLWAGLASAD